MTITAFAAIAVFRLGVPVYRSLRHRLVVEEVEPIADGIVSIRLRGVALDRLGATGGQFFVWRFLARGQWWQAHPYSLSAAPRGGELRIMVRALGRGSAGVAAIRPGTRVALEGPYGIFSEASRSRSRLVLVAAGIGVTPVRSLLESASFRPGEAIVLLRTRTADEGWLLDEVRQLCHARGATLITIPGRRGTGWLSEAAEQQGLSLAAFVPAIADSDVYVCGPLGWSEAVVAEARSAGLRPEQVHHERFDW